MNVLAIISNKDGIKNNLMTAINEALTQSLVPDQIKIYLSTADCSKKDKGLPADLANLVKTSPNVTITWLSEKFWSNPNLQEFKKICAINHNKGSKLVITEDSTRHGTDYFAKAIDSLNSNKFLATEIEVVTESYNLNNEFTFNCPNDFKRTPNHFRFSGDLIIDTSIYEGIILDARCPITCDFNDANFYLHVINAANNIKVAKFNEKIESIKFNSKKVEFLKKLESENPIMYKDYMTETHKMVSGFTVLKTEPCR